MSPRDRVDDEADGRAERRPADSPYHAPEAEAILRRVIDIIDGSPGMPMSASVRVNKDEVLELLEDAVARLPDELRSARWLLKEREEFLARQQREGDAIIAEATARAAQMVQRVEVYKSAQIQADQLIEDAEATSRRMRRETEDYCDQKLASFENVLAKISKSVSNGRKRLAAPTIEEAELGGRNEEAADDPRPSPVFDQDI
jgi:hypothetical protein